MKLNKKIYSVLAAGVPALLMGLASAPEAAASEMVYVPINPNFGGNPLNAPGLLNSAQVTNKHKDPDAKTSSSFLQKTPLQQFNDMLERSILSRLSSAATSSILGTNGELTTGTVETGNFSINIAEEPSGLLQITTTDKVTGDSTSFQVGQ